MRRAEWADSMWATSASTCGATSRRDLRMISVQPMPHYLRKAIREIGAISCLFLSTWDGVATGSMLVIRVCSLKVMITDL